MSRSKFYAAQTKRNARPMTFEADRNVPNWDREDPQTQSLERGLKQRNHLREDVEERGRKNRSI